MTKFTAKINVTITGKNKKDAIAKLAQYFLDRAKGLEAIPPLGNILIIPTKMVAKKEE